jgi:hypothetical protein
MDFLPFFEWCYQTALGEGIRESTWLFPLIEAFHLLGFALTLGSALIVDLRLLGFGLSRQPVAEISSGARPWMLGGVIVMFASGVPLFMSEAVKCYYSPAFWIKMTSLFLVLVFTLVVRSRLTRPGANPDGSAMSRAAAFVSLGLWFGVAWGGRWIGFS